jgi:phosphocarrier protein HPr
MIEQAYRITAAEGIHARPATALIRLVKPFKSAVTISKGEKKVKLNSMLNILSLGAKGGDTVRVEIEGEDEQEAAAAIAHFFSTEISRS